MPDAKAIAAATEAVAKVLAGPVAEPQYIVLQVLKTIADAEAENEAADDEMVRALADDELGELVRETWIEWAREQPDFKLTQVAPLAILEDPQRDVDVRIGIAVANRVLAHLKARKHALIVTVDELILLERSIRADMLRLHGTKIAELQKPW